MALSGEEFHGKIIRALKTLVAKKIGVCRFRQRWLSQDHTELQDNDFATASDVQLLLLHYVPAEGGDFRKLCDACHINDVAQVDELLRKPLHPDVQDVDRLEGKTALHISAQSGHVECLALLLEAGTEKDLADLFERTALHRAAERGNLEAVRLLLVAGADKDKADWEDRTALHLAALTGYPDVVQLLLEADADRDVRDSDRRTALNLAAKCGHLNVVWLLLEAGADKNAVDSYGMTALGWAAQTGHLEIMKLLES